MAILRTCPNMTLAVERDVKPQLWPKDFITALVLHWMEDFAFENVHETISIKFHLLIVFWIWMNFWTYILLGKKLTPVGKAKKEKECASFILHSQGKLFHR